MKTLTVEQQTSLAYHCINTGGAILGVISFCDESYDDFNSMKDTYCIDSEINVFAIIHKVDKVVNSLGETATNETLLDLAEYGLCDSESYIVPSLYCGQIIVAIE